MKQTKLYDVNVTALNDTEGCHDQLSNVVIIGFDTDGVLTLFNFLDSESLESGQAEDVYSACEEIVNELGLRSTKCSENKSEMSIPKIKYNSPYEATVDGMLSANYKERFKAEYQQTKMRYEKLKAFCNRIEAADVTSYKGALGVEMPKHDCPLGLLRDQQHNMGGYLHCLEIRAVIEGIDLT